MAPPEDLPGREVTVVVLDERGAALGTTGPFELATPWWQEVGPVVERLGDAAVLRLLSAERAPGHPMGGRVTYLAQLLGAPRRSLAVELDAGGDHDAVAGLADDPLRMPWARPGGPADDLAWAAAHLGGLTSALQRRTWNLSAIWELRGPRGAAWLKCVPPFFAHESTVLGLLSGESVPRVLATDGHRQLLAPMEGDDGYHASFAQHVRLIGELTELQARTSTRAGELLAAGVPDQRLPSLAASLADLVARHAPTVRPLRRLVDDLPERLAAIEACGLPDVLVHGDAHPGNARVGGPRPIWFDWGDSCVGHPLLDLRVTLHDTDGDRARVVGPWLAAWEAAVPGADAIRAWDLLRPLVALRDAAIFQGFLDRIEASERPYHDLDVAPALELAARLAATSGGLRALRTGRLKAPSVGLKGVAGEVAGRLAPCTRTSDRCSCSTAAADSARPALDGSSPASPAPPQPCRGRSSATTASLSAR